MTLAIPLIHMNGTSRRELVRQLWEAIGGITNAMDLLADACPNGRDYYPKGPDAIQEALRQHNNRLHNLMAARDELTEIAEAIA